MVNEMNIRTRKWMVNAGCCLSSWYAFYLSVSFVLMLLGVKPIGKIASVLIYTTLYASPIALLLAVVALMILFIHRTDFTRRHLRTGILVAGTGISGYLVFLLWVLSRMGSFAI